MYMKDMLCTAGDCTNAAKVRGMCKTHYERWRNTGDAKPGEPIGSLNPRNYCSVDGCDLPCSGQGLCGTHYQRLMKHGDVMADVPRRIWSETGVCSIEQCERKVFARGLCGPHDMRVREYGDPRGGPPLPEERPTHCTVDGCNRPVANRGMCNAHDKRVTAFGDPMADRPIQAVRRTPCDPGFKWCSQCTQELSVSEFGPKVTTPDGLNRWCYTCVWRRFIFTTYNITHKDYEEMSRIQEGCCYLCKRPETLRDVRSRVRRLSIDHDHACCLGTRSCGKCIRGLLCNVCNRVLGMIRDEPELADAMATYLRRGGASYVEEFLNARCNFPSDDQRNSRRWGTLADEIREHIVS